MNENPSLPEEEGKTPDKIKRIVNEIINDADPNTPFGDVMENRFQRSEKYASEDLAEAYLFLIKHALDAPDLEEKLKEAKEMFPQVEVLFLFAKSVGEFTQNMEGKNLDPKSQESLDILKVFLKKFENLIK